MTRSKVGSHVAKVLVAACCAGTLVYSTAAYAGRLNDIIASGKLRCGEMLDYPPLGFYNSKHEPVGYDVDWCNDMAKELGVKPVIVDTPSADRIPALMSGQVDVSISGASNTLQRAKTVLFSIPYNVTPWEIVARDGTGIHSFKDLKGRTLAVVRGALPGINLIAYNKEHWDGATKFIFFGNDALKALAVEQGKADAFVPTLPDAVRLVKKFKNFHLAGTIPVLPDVNAIMVKPGEYDFLHWINLFIYQEARHGEYAKLYEKWNHVKPSQVPSLAVPEVYY